MVPGYELRAEGEAALGFWAVDAARENQPRRLSIGYRLEPELSAQDMLSHWAFLGHQPTNNYTETSY